MFIESVMLKDGPYVKLKEYQNAKADGAHEAGKIIIKHLETARHCTTLDEFQEVIAEIRKALTPQTKEKTV